VSVEDRKAAFRLDRAGAAAVEVSLAG
jgi:hypothetical protein